MGISLHFVHHITRISSGNFHESEKARHSSRVTRRVENPLSIDRTGEFFESPSTDIRRHPTKCRLDRSWAMTIFLISLGKFHRDFARICIYVIPEVAVLLGEQWLAMDLSDASLAFMTSVSRNLNITYL